MAKKVTKKIKAVPLKEDNASVTGGTVSNAWLSLSAFSVQAAILGLLCLIFYFNTFSHEYAFDDRMAIVDNDYVQQGVSGIQDILRNDAYESYLEHKNGSNQLAGGRYRPLSLITFAIEQQFLGINNESSTEAKENKLIHDMHSRHVVNVLLYILSIIVLLYFLRKIIFRDNPYAAFLAALVFTILPVHTEVVANVKSRDEILSVLFICLTFIKAFAYKEHKKTGDLLLALFCFFLALLSKEYAVMLVLLIPLAFYLFRKDTLTNSIKAVLPYLIPLVLYLLLRFHAVSSMAEGAEHNVMNNPYLFASGTQKIATEIIILLRYLQLLVFPNVLSADYSYNQIPYTDFSNPLVWFSLVLHLVLIVSTCYLFTKRHVLGFAIAIYLANLLLVSNFLFNIGAPMGERLIYHSSVGFAIAVAYLLYWIFEKIKSPVIRKAAAGVIAVLIVLSGIKTIARNKDWKNDVILFTADVKNVPNSVLVNNNVAAAYMSLAKQNMADIPLRNEFFSKAIAHFGKAISIYPGHTLSYLNRGLCYYNTGDQDKALSDWDTVRKYSPNEQNLAKYFSILGRYYFAQGLKYTKENKPDSAVLAYRKCAESTPGIPDAWYNLGSAYYTAGQVANAKTSLEQALKIAPDYTDAAKLYEQVKNMPVAK